MHADTFYPVVFFIRFPSSRNDVGPMAADSTTRRRRTPVIGERRQALMETSPCSRRRRNQRRLVRLRRQKSEEDFSADLRRQARCCHQHRKRFTDIRPPVVHVAKCVVLRHGWRRSISPRSRRPLLGINAPRLGHPVPCNPTTPPQVEPPLVLRPRPVARRSLTSDSAMCSSAPGRVSSRLLGTALTVARPIGRAA